MQIATRIIHNRQVVITARGRRQTRAAARSERFKVHSERTLTVKIFEVAREIACVESNGAEIIAIGSENPEL